MLGFNERRADAFTRPCRDAVKSSKIFCTAIKKIKYTAVRCKVWITFLLLILAKSVRDESCRGDLVQISQNLSQAFGANRFLCIALN